jgi:hypothetical protein
MNAPGAPQTAALRFTSRNARHRRHHYSVGRRGTLLRRPKRQCASSSALLRKGRDAPPRRIGRRSAPPRRSGSTKQRAEQVPAVRSRRTSYSPDARRSSRRSDAAGCICRAAPTASTASTLRVIALREEHLSRRNGGARRRSPAALSDFHQGRAPRNKGLRYPGRSASISRSPPSTCAGSTHRDRQRRHERSAPTTPATTGTPA